MQNRKCQVCSLNIGLHNASLKTHVSHADCYAMVKWFRIQFGYGLQQAFSVTRNLIRSVS